MFEVKEAEQLSIVSNEINMTLIDRWSKSKMSVTSHPELFERRKDIFMVDCLEKIAWIEGDDDDQYLTSFVEKT